MWRTAIATRSRRSWRCPWGRSRAGCFERGRHCGRRFWAREDRRRAGARGERFNGRDLVCGMSDSREELESRIAAYIDGELPAAEAARLEVFLANTDPALADQVIGMLADKHRIRAMPGAKAPED